MKGEPETTNQGINNEEEGGGDLNSPTSPKKTHIARMLERNES